MRRRISKNNKRTRSRRTRSRRGGSFMGTVQTAIAPFSLLAAQQLFNKRKTKKTFKQSKRRFR